MSDNQYFLDRSLGFLLGDSSRLLRKRFDRLARSFGMTRAQWGGIAVPRRDEGINQTAMADAIRRDAQEVDRVTEKTRAVGGRRDG